jgi:hypothetical protein
VVEDGEDKDRDKDKEDGVDDDEKVEEEEGQQQQHQYQPQPLEEQYTYTKVREQGDAAALFCCHPMSLKPPPRRKTRKDYGDETRVHMTVNRDTTDIPLSEYTGTNSHVTYSAERDSSHVKTVHWKN